MNFLDILHELLLALCIAILLPVTLYWGVNTIYENPNYKDFEIQSNLEAKDEKIVEANTKLQTENWQKAKKPFDQAIFYASLIIGFLAIVIGSFISINGLAIGLVAGGFIIICMCLVFNPGIAILNFSIFLFLLVTIISLTVIKRRNYKIIINE